MSTNPPNLRPDLAPKAQISNPSRPGQPTIGMVSLGCPKALVDSERILTRLRAEGWRTLRALSEDEDPRALGCTHRLEDGAPTAL